MMATNHVSTKSRRSGKLNILVWCHMTCPPCTGAPALIEHKNQRFLIINNPTPATLSHFINVRLSPLLISPSAFFLLSHIIIVLFLTIGVGEAQC